MAAGRSAWGLASPSERDSVYCVPVSCIFVHHRWFWVPRQSRIGAKVLAGWLQPAVSLGIYGERADTRVISSVAACRFSTRCRKGRVSIISCLFVAVDWLYCCVGEGRFATHADPVVLSVLHSCMELGDLAVYTCI